MIATIMTPVGLFYLSATRSRSADCTVAQAQNPGCIGQDDVDGASHFAQRPEDSNLNYRCATALDEASAESPAWQRCARDDGVVNLRFSFGGRSLTPGSSSASSDKVFFRLLIEIGSYLKTSGDALFVCGHVDPKAGALSWVTDSRAPIAVVTSESMEPGFQRGDVLLLWNRPNHITVGDIALVAFPTRKLPMVHRVLQSYYLPTVADGAGQQTRQYIRTKGDNCETDDALLYPNEEGLASRENVIGLVRGIVPYLGLPVIKMNELLSRPTRYVL
ncbi:hypothetical protein LMH87_011902 [Akanthomyces muscarius]|uniref:Signal peptidase complex catalytic subunit SEC11 n=1 Tax=Akanthomyces muscarius TaxID=2231603 RepID=A0A9W8QC89_AKAMU|nr:hypothetical protein LMH87_011902 [Akanthomyces muscarius]KAJ4151187.1 hypothetical protein LMH87_011902 [Akanthomyces muscarius]